MPGAAYEGHEGDNYNVSMKVRIGAIRSHFLGTVHFLDKNENMHSAVIRGVGKNKRGKGAATATVTTRLEALSTERTRVVVHTDLSMTGRLAQFGSGVISDIASLLLTQFTDNLHREGLARSSVVESHANGAPADIHPSVDEVKPQKKQEAVDLGAAMRSVGLNYLQELVVPLACFLLGWLVGRVYISPDRAIAKAIAPSHSRVGGRRVGGGPGPNPLPATGRLTEG